MHLSQTEVARAKAIKTAVEASQSLINLTDFEYAQYALTTGNETIEEVCERVSRMQAFRHQYRLEDTLAEGVVLVHQMTRQHPGVYLAVSLLRACQNYLLVEDCAAFVPPKTDEEVRLSNSNQHEC